jgi:hypothetical protein
VAGYGKYAIFDNITLSGTLTFTSGVGYAGGVVGIVRSEGTVIRNCSSSLTMDITPFPGALIAGLPNPFSFVGGIAGYMEDQVGIENCHNTGDVKGVTDAPLSQVMVGGILGGTFYGFSDWYNGYITDCSSTGDITVGCTHFWPFAGGIAGVICGGYGKLENSTRITRCFAKGTITTVPGAGGTFEDLTGQWPYVGGIVGYIYFGSWVSQCWFDGTIIVNQTNDYTGGIAGYISFATSNTGVPCVLEDCWSDGKVTGYNNAGGIVGQQQANTIVRRCYSLAEVRMTNGDKSNAAQHGIGGITGVQFSTWKDANIGNVALNKSITAVRTYNKAGEIHRIAGRVSTPYPVMKNNFALPSLTPVANDNTYKADKGADRPDGADIPAGAAEGLLSPDGKKPTRDLYVALDWDFTNVWEMGSDGYPKLRWK